MRPILIGDTVQYYYWSLMVTILGGLSQGLKGKKERIMYVAVDSSSLYAIILPDKDRDGDGKERTSA